MSLPDIQPPPFNTLIDYKNVFTNSTIELHPTHTSSPSSRTSRTFNRETGYGYFAKKYQAATAKISEPNWNIVVETKPGM